MKHLLEKQDDKNIRSIAYFSMEIGIENSIPTYSGGLGILAGDTIKSYADLVVPVVAVSIISRNGYFRQNINKDGEQKEAPVNWHPESFLKRMPETIKVDIEGREVHVQAWELMVKGITGFFVPVYFLDTDLSQNREDDRKITDDLYGGDSRYRIKQEAVLGIAGIRMLDKLGYTNLKKYHMNEGHSAFLTLELLRQTKKPSDDVLDMYDVVQVKKKCVFTTHTPVPAGHDQFLKEDVESIIGENFLEKDFMKDYFVEGKLNMTMLAFLNSEYVNGVAMRHREVSRTMFPGFRIDSITNGVHSATWTSEEFKTLYDKHIPGWRQDPFNLRYVLSISRMEIWEAHLEAKKKLIDYVNAETKIGMDYNTFTIGFARRSTPYKRLELFFREINTLLDIHENVGNFQVVLAGKAHPHDSLGKETIKRVHDIMKKLEGKIKVVYLENYDMEMAKFIVSGVDLWLNTPRRPMEASGTSGMKAAHNGIPSFSVLDGWWVEGHVENVTGWSIGPHWKEGEFKEDYASDEEDSKELYFKLREIIIPMFYKDWDKWTEIMRHAISFNASFFNTHRMAHQYVLNSYFH